MTAIRAMARGVCCLLAAALLAVSSAAGETEKTGQAEETGNTVSREERMAEARARYNEKTVNIYRNGHGKNQRGKINVRFYTSRDDNGVYINVRESLQIRDQDEMEAWLDSLSDEDFNDLRFHGHSHVNMSVIPSGTDVSMYNDTVARIRQDSFYIFCILNKSGNRTFQIYDLKKNIFFDTADITFLIGNEVGIQETVQGAKTLVREKKYSYNTGYNYGGYGAYGGSGYNGQTYLPATTTAQKPAQTAETSKTEQSSGKKKKKGKKKEKVQVKQVDEPGEITVKIIIKNEEKSDLVETYYGAQNDTIFSLIEENGLEWRDTVAKLDLVEVPLDAYSTPLSDLAAACGLSQTMDHNLVLISEVDAISPFGYGYDDDDESPYSAFGYM